MGLFGKIGEGLRKTRAALAGNMSAMLRSFTRIDGELLEELEEMLIMAVVGAGTASRICAQLRDRCKAEGVSDPAEVRRLAAELERPGP